MKSKLKIAIVSPRFSVEIAGGAEKHALKFAMLLNEKYDVTVLTTTALDYKTWENELGTGESFLQNLKIIRFGVDKKRNIKSFNKLSDKILRNHLENDDQTTNLWIEKQGPFSKNLVHFIQENEKFFDLFFFISYLYYPTVVGIQTVKKKSILLPTLHDEFPAYFSIYKKTFTNEVSYCFNTIEELGLFKRIFRFTPSNFSVIGVNIEKINSTDNKIIPEKLKTIFPIDSKSEKKVRYALYIGRSDEGKGVSELFNFFNEWKMKFPSDFKLIFIGEKFQESEDIISTGYLSEEEKNFLLRNATFLFNPSSMESFSMVIMEAWVHRIPVIVNEKSDVMKCHCIRSNGGLYYRDKESFFKVLNFLLAHEEIRKQMGENGTNYVLKNYSSDTVREKLFDLIEKTAHLSDNS